MNPLPKTKVNFDRKKSLQCFLILTSILFLFTYCKPEGNDGEAATTGVKFSTSDRALQKVYDLAEERCLEHVADFHGYKVLIEGGGYSNVWLETQPMGGVMYAKRDVAVAKNNVEIFIDFQRGDGRMPGLVRNGKDSLSADFFRFQGNCFPMPAFELYYWLGKDKEYLRKVYKSLESWDAYLWNVRDSDGNGCLETWCFHDTGEDHSIRFGTSPTSWPYDFPPNRENLLNLDITQDEMDYLFVYQLRPMRKEQREEWNKREGVFYEVVDNMPVPMESMDIMSYSYSNRDVLALISRELKNGKEEYWRQKAEEVRKKLKDYLWDTERKACFDRDKNNEVMDVLVHNNLRCMWYGSFDQEMADGFVETHLLNPGAFWTPFPLPSIAVSDPLFRNNDRNDWSGQPQGLTFQRSIHALESYGYYSELTQIGKKFLEVTSEYLRFPQQYDPFTGIPGDKNNLNYGPGILASLEFISRFYGIHLSKDKLYWSCLDDGNEYSYSQQWGNRVFDQVTRGDKVICSINGKEVFSYSKGARVVSDLKGKPIEVVGIDTDERDFTLNYKGKTREIKVSANGLYRLN
jgi:hypothetical protein